MLLAFSFAVHDRLLRMRFTGEEVLRRESKDFT